MIKLLMNLKNYKKTILLIFGLVLIQSLSDVYLPNLMSDIVNNGVVRGDINYILTMGVKMLGVAIIGSIATICASYLSSKTSMGFGRDLRKRVFEKVETLSLKEFNELGTSSLITRTTNDINQIQQVVIVMLRMMLYAPMVLIGAIIMAVTTDSKLSLIILIVMPILIISIISIAKVAVSLFKKMQKRVDNLNRVTRENLVGVRVIRVFNKIETERQRFEKANLELSSIAMKANRVVGLLMPIMMLIVNLSTIAIVWFGGIQIEVGNMQIGDLMAFIQYLAQIMFALMMMSMMFVMIPRASASADRINEVLNTKNSVKESDNPITNSESNGYVEFKNVSFSYDKESEEVLSDISFVSKKGEVTAIIGGTGSGKSTLIKLILRFFDATNGNIIVDGINIKDLSIHHLREKIGYVPQKAVLFSGSIKENLKYGDKNISDDKINKVLDIAQASAFVNEMDENINSYISQGGTNVSGGQKQRLSIARALSKKPSIYIFDDSFSALDFKTDKNLRSALKDETNDSTVIIVAQRVSTVVDADKIIVLNDGKISSIGKHEELLKTCDIYKEIVSSQLSKEEM